MLCIICIMILPVLLIKFFILHLSSTYLQKSAIWSFESGPPYTSPFLDHTIEFYNRPVQHSMKVVKHTDHRAALAMTSQVYD